MRSSIVALFALPILSLSIAAQTASQNSAPRPKSFLWQQGAAQASSTIVLRSDGSATGVTACPIGMRARQSGGGQLLEARNLPPHVPVSRLRLTLFHWPQASDLPDPSQVREATLTVRGQMARAHLVPADESSAVISPDGVKLVAISRTLTVRFAPPDEEGISTDLTLPGFAFTRLIELDSITYADGATRKFSGRDSCRIAPDPLMLVEAR